MNPKEVVFPWNDKIEESLTPEEPKKTKASLWENRIKKYTPFSLLIICLGVVGYSQATKKPIEKKTYTLAVLVSPSPIKKGEKIRNYPLKLIQVSSKDITRSQKLNLLTLEDIDQRNLNIVAKKNIAPRKPLFWSDLKLSEAVKQKTNTVILYRSTEK